MLLITGATGFIGRCLLPSLLKDGHGIRVLSRSAAQGDFPRKVEVRRGDITDPSSMKGALDDVETVVHLAGLVSYSKPKAELFRVNVEGTRNLLAECRDVCRFVFPSSVSVYGETKERADETYPFSPESHYGESKAEAERLVAASRIHSVILRIAPIYGVGSASWQKNLRLLERGFPLPSTRNTTHVVHVSDAAQGILKALKRGKGAYNIADRSPVPFSDFAGELVTLLGRKPRRMPMPFVSALARAMGMGTYLKVLTMNRNYAIDKAAEGLGYRPSADFHAEMRRMVEWYKSVS